MVLGVQDCYFASSSTVTALAVPQYCCREQAIGGMIGRPLAGSAAASLIIGGIIFVFRTQTAETLCPRGQCARES
jgi:hypothetical protein